ncbi:MAG: class I SAM-dependent methyltransferase [Phycisphaeraceae bacterium]|nr:class I SAM-dependent methyltransferase [Phycisphaeraceae bacterium]
MSAPSSVPTIQKVYPEHRFGGFSRFDATVHFGTRVQALLGPDDVVLDVGCGRGKRMDDPCAYRRALQDFRGQNRRVVGIDVDTEAQTNPYITEFHLISDVRRWPVADASVNLVYADYVLEHVNDPALFFAEANRVLKPGGYLCFRTPNAYSYIAIISRCTPNRYHARVLSVAYQKKAGRDVFPTVYKCNTRRAMRRFLRQQGWTCAVYTVESEPNYLRFSPLLYRLGAVVHRLLPPVFRSTLLAFAQKPPTN